MAKSIFHHVASVSAKNAASEFNGKVSDIYFRGLEPVSEGVVKVFFEITTPLLESEFERAEGVNWELLKTEAEKIEKLLSHFIMGEVEWVDTSASTGYVFSAVL